MCSSEQSPVHELGVPEPPAEEIACSPRDRSVSPVTLLSVTLVCEAGFDVHLVRCCCLKSKWQKFWSGNR